MSHLEPIHVYGNFARQQLLLSPNDFDRSREFTWSLTMVKRCVVYNCDNTNKTARISKGRETAEAPSSFYEREAVQLQGVCLKFTITHLHRLSCVKPICCRSVTTWNCQQGNWSGKILCCLAVSRWFTLDLYYHNLHNPCINGIAYFIIICICLTWVKAYYISLFIKSKIWDIFDYIMLWNVISNTFGKCQVSTFFNQVPWFSGATVWSANWCNVTVRWLRLCFNMFYSAGQLISDNVSWECMALLG